MDKKLVFDYMNKNVVCSHVEVNLRTREVYCEDFTNVVHHLVFAKRPHTVENLNFFFETRCFPRGREDEKDILEFLGLRQYNPLDIVRKTHGVMYKDYNWIRFEGENIQWEDVKIRD